MLWLLWLFGVAVFLIALFVFVIISIISFIMDGIRAKREETGRETYIKVMFIISMAIIALVVVGWILFYILGMLFMRSM